MAAGVVVAGNLEAITFMLMEVCLRMIMNLP